MIPYNVVGTFIYIPSNRVSAEHRSADNILRFQELASVESWLKDNQRYILLLPFVASWLKHFLNLQSIVQAALLTMARGAVRSSLERLLSVQD